MMNCPARPGRLVMQQGTPAMNRIGCTMTGGTSGGGWFVNRGGKLTLVSNTSISPTPTPGWPAPTSARRPSGSSPTSARSSRTSRGGRGGGGGSGPLRRRTLDRYPRGGSARHSASRAAGKALSLGVA